MKFFGQAAICFMLLGGVFAFTGGMSKDRAVQGMGLASLAFGTLMAAPVALNEDK